MFAIELSIKLGSVERELDLLGGVDSLLKQAPLVAVSSLGEQQHVTRFQVRVFQRQRPLSTITDATLQAFFLSLSLLWGGTCSFRMPALTTASQAGAMRNPIYTKQFLQKAVFLCNL